MNTITRRRFLKASAFGIAVASASRIVTGCSAVTRLVGHSSRPIKILSLGDMHLTNQASMSYPRKVIKAMNEDGGDLVLVCGDLGSKPTRPELELAKEVLEGLKMPYYPVLGNHDAVFSGEKEETLFREVFSLVENNYHFEYGGIRFIGIDHGCGNAHHANSVRPAVMTWLKKTLAIVPDSQPLILFSHYPFGKGVKYRTKNADSVKALFKERKLLAMISGHFHGNTERREEEILMTTTACCSSTRRNHDGTKPKGYRVFNIDHRLHVTTEFIEVEA